MRLKLIAVISFAAVFTAACVMVSCQSDDKLEFDHYYSLGRVVYQQHCQNCHGANGEGLQSLIPPLNDSLYIKANQHKLACYVKYGLKEKITISGRQFEGAMPANDVPAIEIAEVLTYVANSFGNKTGELSIGRVQADLLNCK